MADRNPDRSREQVFAAVAAVCAIAGIPAALVAGRPFSSIALIVVAIVLPALMLFWAFRRPPRNRRPQRLAVIASVLIYGTMGLVMVIPSSRHVVLFDLLQLPGGDKPKIAQLTTRSDDPEHETIRVVVQNRAKKPDLVQHVSLRWGDFDRSHTCNSNVHYRYTLSDSAKFRTGSPGTQTFFAFASEGVWSAQGSGDPSAAGPADAGTKIKVSGAMNVESCYGWFVSLGFDVTVPLDAESFAIMDFVVPSTIKVSDLSVEGVDRSPAGRTKLRFFAGYNEIEATATLADADETVRLGKHFDDFGY